MARWGDNSGARQKDQMAKPKTPVNIRRERGFEPASGLLKESFRVAAEKRGFALSRLLTQWAEVAGEDIARVTRPVKMSYGRDGFGATLVLLVSSARAPEVQMQLPRLRERVNACYGYNAIGRIHLTQTAETGFAEGQAEFTPAPRKAPVPDPGVVRQAAETAGGIHDPALRAALEALARNVLSRSKT